MSARNMALGLLVVVFGLSVMAGGQLKLDYSSFLGGSANDWGYAVATDSSGAIYIAGFSQSSDFPLVSALQAAYAGGTGDLFVAKFKPDGTGFQYITYIGGSGGEGDPGGYVGGIAVDTQGNAYVAGITRSPDFPTTPGAYQPSIGSKYVCDSDPDAGLCGDAFVLKLSPAGDRLVYSTYLGGSGYDDAKAIAIDSAGAAYITGMTASPDFPVTNGAYQSQLDDVDAYAAKISPDGSRLLYSTLVGGSEIDAGMAIAVDALGRAYLAGATQSPDFPLKNALQTQFGDPWDGFVIRVNPTGSDIDFSTLLGGSGTDEAFAIALDNTGNIYVAGMTDSPDFPLKNAFQPQLAGGASNAFVTKLRGDGDAIVYSTFLGGGDGQSQLNAIAVDSSGNAYVAGQGGSDFPTVNTLQCYRGGLDAVVARLTPDGSGLLYSTFLGGSGADLASGIALDPTGRIVITGQTSSSNLPISTEAFQSFSTGLPDAFVARIAPSAAKSPIFSSPKSLSIGQAYVGVWSAPQTIPITNPGPQALTLTSITGSTNLKVASTCSEVVPGGACSLSASLLASVTGNQSGTISVFDNAPDSPQTIFVTATGVSGGDLALTSLVSGSSFNFYGRTAIPITASITNHGPNDSLNVMLNISSSGGLSNCNPCYIGTIKAATSAVFRFNFVPSVYGMIPLTVQVRASASTPDVNLSNNTLSLAVTNPRYAISLAQLTFNQQTVGLASSPQTVTFTSLDQNPLQLSFSTDGDFSAASSCDPGALRCYAFVRFSPSAEGTRSGILTVTEAVAATTQPIPLSGTGVLAPDLKLSATQLSFIAGVTGTGTAPDLVTLTNDGSAPLFLVSISVVGSFVQSNQCPPSLLPGQSCQVEVSYVAASAGTFSGNLTIADNTSARATVIPLTGTGIPPVTLSRPSRPSSGGSSSSSQTSTNTASAPSVNGTARPARPPTISTRQALSRMVSGASRNSR